ncbi:hypothetical protein [Chimaeribacter arupi]|uniref:hypothetical protein n=1 Tax=Chimaeribacter arupi TaxID=2060066 RepID=UPI00294787D3|nr:hypothetical protein [Chimaeribacter arupi]MDV5139022.1 hypothetical protein [Chimaeribacter arupi]
MFYFRANQVKLTSNGSTRTLFNWRKDLSDVKLISFVTTSQSILPDIDTWLDSNDPAQKTALLARAVQSVSSSQILTTVENVKDNARLTFGTTGYNLFQSDKIPEDVNWCLMAIKSNKDTRELGSVFSSIADHAEFHNFATSLGSLVATAANPAFRAGVEITKFVTEVMSQRLQDEDDEQLGLLYLSLNRKQHYPYGERKENAVTDLTGNMLVDYSIFGVEEGAAQQSAQNAAPQNGSEPAPSELAKQTVEAGLAAAAAAARQTLAEKASAAATVPDQPADVLAKRAKAFLKERESGVLDQARQIMAGIAGAAASAAGDAAGQALTDLTTQLGAAALKAITGNAPPVGTPVQGIAPVSAIPDQPADVLAGGTGTSQAATQPTGGSGTEPQDGTTSGDPGASGAPGAPIANVTQKTVVEAGSAPVGDVLPAGTEPAPGVPPSGKEVIGDTPPDRVPPAGQDPATGGAPAPDSAAQPAPDAQPAAAPADQPAADAGSSAIPDQPADVLAAGTGTDNAATQPSGGSGTEPQDGTSSGDPRTNMPLGNITEKQMIEIKAAAAPSGDVQPVGKEVPDPGGKEVIAETPPEHLPPAGQDQPAAAPAAAPAGQPAADAGSSAIPDQPADALAAGTGTDNAATQPSGGSGTEPQDGTTSGDTGGAISASTPTSGETQAVTEAAASAAPVDGVQTAQQDGPTEAGEYSPDAVASGKEVIAETPADAVPAAGQDQAAPAGGEAAPAAPQPAAADSSAAAAQPADAATGSAATQPTGGSGTEPQDGTASGDSAGGQDTAGSAAIPDQPAEALAAGQTVTPAAGIIVQSEDGSTVDGSQPAAEAAAAEPVINGSSAQPAAAPAVPESATQAATETAAAEPAGSDGDADDIGFQEIVVGSAPDAAAPAGGQPAGAGQAVDPGSDPAAGDAQKTQK